MGGSAEQGNAIRRSSSRHVLHHWRAITRVAVLASALGALAGLPTSGPAAAGSLDQTTSPYVVGALNTTGTAAALAAVSSVGAPVTMTLPAADAVLAQLDPTQVTLLSAVPGIVVTPDVSVSVLSTTTDDPPHTPSAVFPQQTGAASLWAQGDTGAGATVAVLDTGIDPLPDFAGRLVGGVDLSGGNNPFNDQFGHGTFVAGLVAGNGASSGGLYTGEAPGAQLVSIKVAGASGSTDLATIISGVSWAIANRATLHIGVMNMSLGYQPIESTALDPLDVAVENAWQSGIVVITSAGNSGPFNGSVLSPGDDPLVVTAGAVDDLAQSSPANDVMTTFSSVGPTQPDGWLKPDLVASGRSVVSLRAPGSTIDSEYPGSRVGTANFVGSGTSFSAAITSGAAALLLAAHPFDGPSTVKAALLGSTLPGPVGNPVVDGHGDLYVAGAVALSPQPSLLQLPSSVAVAMGTTVSLSSTWTESTWNPANWNGESWNGGSWNGESWNGGSWNGESWNGESWNGESWNGESWNGESWNGESWNGESWNGESWNGESWNGESWNGGSWN
ncbi:MAG: S8 family serine peptidase [Acidimicrobiales bacterium]